MHSVGVRGCLGILGDFLCYKSCIDWNEAENGRETRVHKVNRRLVIFWE